jgi:RNA polymerase sigma-70 factor (ECF subfamily)
MTTKSFDKKVEEYTNTLEPFALNLTKDMEKARDLLQETMLRALKNKDKFAEGTNLKGWLFTIMKNIFINDYRKRVKRNTIFDTTEELYYINTSASTKADESETTVVLDEIYKAIDNLNKDYRVPFMMHYKGYKYQEIADYLNLPLGTVKSRIFFARKELQGKLNRY